MTSINKAIISGNLGDNAKLNKSNPNVLTFSVAVNEYKKTKDGAWEEKTNWVNCVVFGERATKLEQKLIKGTKVTVEGKLEVSTYEKGGEKKTSVSVVANNIDIHTKTDGAVKEEIKF